MNIFIDPPTEHEKKSAPKPLYEPRIENRMPTMQQLAVALGVLVVVFAASYIPGFARDHAKKDEPVIETTTSREPLPLEIDSFEGVELTARAAYVWDVRNQRALYNKNAGEQLPLASLTKLMTVLVAYEQRDPTDIIPISADAILQDGDSNLAIGETFTVRDLADFTLITSSNDGAYALASSASGATNASPAEVDTLQSFVAQMNSKAEAIGLTRSYFTNPTGLDVSTTTSGGYGSARDMAFLMEYLVEKYPSMLAKTKEPMSLVHNQLGAAITAYNTNDVVGKIPGLIGSKTGFTDLAGGNLVIAFDAGLNRPIIISVLGSTRSGRFSDVINLVTRTQQTLNAE